MNLLKRYSSWATGEGYALKSLYCNEYQVDTIGHSDFKVDGLMSPMQLESMARKRLFFSTGDDVHQLTKNFLQEIFPNPSRWEKA